MGDELLFVDVGEPRDVGDFYAHNKAKAHRARSLTAAERLLEAVAGADQMKLRHAVEVYRADVNSARSADGETAMHVLARQSGSLVQMQYLHKHGADFGLRGPFGATPLHIVCDNPNHFLDKLDTIKFLVSAAPDSLNAKDDDGLTPLLCACQTGDIKTIKALLELGADPRATSNDGHTCVFICTQFAHLHALYYLCIELEYHVHEVDNERRTCLHWAAYHNDVQICAFLRRLGLSPNDKDANGCTPLHWAAIRGNDMCIPVLVMAGGARALEEEDAEGLTPERLARKHNNHRFLQALDRDNVKDPNANPIRDNMKTAMFVIVVLNCACAYCFANDDTPIIMKGVMVVLQCVIWWSLWKSYKTDPGYLCVDTDLSTPPLRLEPRELQRFSPLSDQFPVCYTCNTRRVLRSKHSQFSNKCVARFDHYCPWVSNDVGLGNQGHFVLFVLSVSLTTGYGLVVLFRSVFDDLGAARMPRLWQRHPVVAGLVAHPVIAVVSLLDLVVLVSVSALLLTFVRYIALNLSTNETFNWARYSHFIHPETGRYTNPFTRGPWTNVQEYFGWEKLPGGGRGRLINWRSVPDIATYRRLRNQLGVQSEEMQALTGSDKAV